MADTKKNERPYTALGAFVRRVREANGVKQRDVAASARMRQPQLTHLEKGGNVAVGYYDRVAKVLGFRGVLEMFTSGGDEKTRRLLRLWRALPDDEARTDVLQLVRDQIVADEEPSAKAFAGRPDVKRVGSGRRAP